MAGTGEVIAVEMLGWELQHASARLTTSKLFPCKQPLGALYDQRPAGNSRLQFLSFGSQGMLSVATGQSVARENKLGDDRLFALAV